MNGEQDALPGPTDLRSIEYAEILASTRSCAPQKLHPAVFNAMQHCYIPIARLRGLSLAS